MKQNAKVGFVTVAEIYPEGADDLYDDMDGASGQLGALYSQLLPNDLCPDPIMEAYQLGEVGNVVLIQSVHLDEQFRCRGIGTVVLKKLIREFFRSKKFDLIAIQPFGEKDSRHSQKQNTVRLKVFYERLGFRSTTKSFMLYCAALRKQPTIEQAKAIRTAVNDFVENR